MNFGEDHAGAQGPGAQGPGAQGPGAQGPGALTRSSVLDRAGNGDGDEFALIYGPLAFRLARGLGLGAADAEDVMQVSLVELLKLMRTFQYDRRRGRFRGLLRNVVKHRAHDLLRKQQRYPQQEVDDEQPANGDELESNIEQAWFQVRLQAALDKVRKDVRPSTMQAFILRYLEQKSTAETAHILNQKPDSITRSCRRVIHRLRERLEELEDVDF